MTARKVDAFTLAEAIVEAIRNVVDIVKDERVDAIPAKARILARVTDVYPWGGEDAFAATVRRTNRRREPEGPTFLYVELEDGRTYSVTVELLRDDGAGLERALERMAPP